MRGISYYIFCVRLTFYFYLQNITTQFLNNHTLAICIYGVIFCTGIIRAFTGPVFNVMLAQVVPKKLLQNATTWNQGAILSASVSGHAWWFIDRLYWQHRNIYRNYLFNDIAFVVLPI